MTRQVYAGRLELVTEYTTDQDAPAYLTVADHLTRPDRAVLCEALRWHQQTAMSNRVNRQVARVATRLGLVLGLVLLLTGCQSNSAPRASLVESITYQWEPKAGLCFAALNSWTHGGRLVTSIAWVPASACGKPVVSASTNVPVEQPAPAWAYHDDRCMRMDFARGEPRLYCDAGKYVEGAYAFYVGGKKGAR